jgi:hypothetical protein
MAAQLVERQNSETRYVSFSFSVSPAGLQEGRPVHFEVTGRRIIAFGEKVGLFEGFTILR